LFKVAEGDLLPSLAQLDQIARQRHQHSCSCSPAGGARLLQPASGYLATFVNGVMTRSDDRDTGARPGRLVRSAG